MAKQPSRCAPLYFVKPLYAQLLPQQLTVDTLIHENLSSTTNIGKALHNRADSVVVLSTEHTGIYKST